MLSRLVHLSTVLVAFLTLQLPALGQFETRSTSTILQSPVSVAVADFNHDGKLDSAVAASYYGQVAVLLGNGDGTFQSAVYYNIDNQTLSLSSITVADFNRDGNTDIAVADQFGSNVSILLGNGDGTFQQAVEFPTTAEPTDVAVADFNNDGNLDVIMCDSPFVSVLLGNGDGTFRAPLDTNVSFCSQATGSAIGIADFNHDGKPDVAVVSAELQILIGNGDGTFQITNEYTAGVFDQSLTVADFNSDHKPDIAVTNGSGNQVYVFLGNGDGSFTPEPPFYANQPAAITAADLNGDGEPDLALLTAASPFPATAVTVMLGNGDGSFQGAVNYQVLGEGTFIVIGDVNGDHQPDLVGADYDNAVDIFLNTGAANFSPTTPLAFAPQFVGTGSSPQSVTLTNNGTKILSISRLSITKPFQLGPKTTCKTSVSAGASCNLSVVFLPTGTGFKSGLLEIVDSASSKPQVIEVSGTGTLVTASPSSLNFGTQKTGTKSEPQSVTVTNTGHLAIGFTGVTFAGPAPLDYSQTNTCGTQILSGGSCTISFTFLPFQKGTRRAWAEINGGSGAEWQVVQLTGVGD